MCYFAEHFAEFYKKNFLKIEEEGHHYLLANDLNNSVNGKEIKRMSLHYALNRAQWDITFWITHPTR